MAVKPWLRPNGGRCADPDCTRASVGRSKYCATHRADARKRFVEKVREADAQRQAREAEFELVLGEAEGRAGQPLPELAAVIVRPGGCALARYLKRAEGWRKGEHGGAQSPPFPGMDKADAYAETLRQYGYQADVEALY